MNRFLKKSIAICIGLVLGFSCASWMQSARSLAVESGGAGAIFATTGPSTREASATGPVIPPAAIELEKRAAIAYSALGAARLSATASTDIEAAGRPARRDLVVRSLYDNQLGQPTRFRHEIPGELLIIRSDDSLTLFSPETKSYQTKSEPSSLFDTSLSILLMQNPALRLAVTGSLGLETLTADATIEVKDSTIIVNESGVLTTYAFDPTTHYLSAVNVDMAKLLADQGVPGVKHATATITYAPPVAIAATELETLSAEFRWTPPADARDAATMTDELMSGGDDAKLIGKPMPAIALPDLEGKMVQCIESNKGKVVVLDFWASWCGPCREGLPPLDALSKEFADQGVVVYAINVGEDAPTARGFMQKMGIGLKVLLDQDSAVSGQFSITGIPTTVVIGRDGVVKAWVVGLNEAAIRTAVVEAMR